MGGKQLAAAQMRVFRSNQLHHVASVRWFMEKCVYIIYTYSQCTPSGKRLHNYETSPFFIAKSTNWKAIFRSYINLPNGTFFSKYVPRRFEPGLNRVAFDGKSTDITHRLHAWYIYLHDWVIFRANVGTYSIHGAYGLWMLMVFSPIIHLLPRDHWKCWPSSMWYRETNLDFVGHGFVFHEPRGKHGKGCSRLSKMNLRQIGMYASQSLSAERGNPPNCFI